jgi:cytochrome P450 family 110
VHLLCAVREALWRSVYPADAVRAVGDDRTTRGNRAIYSAEPESVEIFVKEPVPFLGPTSLVQSSGRQHIRRRQVIMPLLSRSSLIDYCAAISDIATRFAAGLKPGDHFVAQEAMHELSLQIILRIFFGMEFAQLEAVREAFLTAQRAMHPSFIFFGLLRRRFFGLGPWARVCRARETLDATIHAVIAGRRAGPPSGGLLDLLLAARFADGSLMSDMEIRDQLVTLVAGGHETLAVGLTWALYWIHRQPQIRERLLAELDQAGWPTDSETVAGLPYLDAVYRETLRLNPIIPEVPRRLRRSFDLLGYQLPAGIGVCAVASLVHMNEELYSDPGSFRPDRFLERR